jgi:hypothetical protein
MVSGKLFFVLCEGLRFCLQAFSLFLPALLLRR